MAQKYSDGDEESANLLLDEAYINIRCLREITAESNSNDEVLLFREIQIEESSVFDESKTIHNQNTYIASVGDVVVSHLTGIPAFLFLCVSHLKTAKCDVFIHGSNIIYVNINQHLKLLDEFIAVITALSKTDEEKGDDDTSFDKLILKASKAIEESFVLAEVTVEEIVSIDEIAFAGSAPTLPLDLVFSKNITLDQIVSRSIYNANNHEGLMGLFESRSAADFQLLGVILLVLYANNCDHRKVKYDYEELEAESLARLELLRPYQPQFTADSCSRMATFKKPVRVVEQYPVEYDGNDDLGGATTSSKGAETADDQTHAINNSSPSAIPPKTKKGPVKKINTMSAEYNIGKPGKRERSKPKHYAQEQEDIQALKKKDKPALPARQKPKTEKKPTIQTRKSAAILPYFPVQNDIKTKCYENDVYNSYNNSVGQYNPHNNSVVPLPPPAKLVMTKYDDKQSSILERVSELEASLKVANNTIELTKSFEVKAATLKAEVIDMFREATEMISDSTRLGASLATKHSTRMGEAIADIVEAVSKPSSTVVSYLPANAPTLQPSPQPSAAPTTIASFVPPPYQNLQHVPLSYQQQSQIHHHAPSYPTTHQWEHFQPPYMQQQYNYFNYQQSNQHHQYQRQQWMMQQQGFNGYPTNIPQMPGVPTPPHNGTLFPSTYPHFPPQP